MIARLLGRAARRQRHLWERGTTAVEMALIAPVFLLLVIGTIDLGRASMTFHMATQGAREGARRGSVIATWDKNAAPPQYVLSAAAKTEIEAAARRQTAGLEQPFQVTSEIVGVTEGGSNVVYYVRVKVSGTYNPVAGGFLRVGSIPIGRTSMMKVA